MLVSSSKERKLSWTGASSRDSARATVDPDADSTFASVKVVDLPRTPPQPVAKAS